MTTHASTASSLRRGARGLALLLLPVVALLATPAHADVPQGWTDPTPVDNLHALALLLGAPLLLFVLISLAVYLPSMIRGEPLLPDHSGGEGQWLGGPSQGTRELPAADDDQSQAGGASGSW